MKYLFTAIMQDGSYICQNHNDTSVKDSTRSSFYDVLSEIEKGNKCLLFYLTTNYDTLTPTDYSVDLRDGHFEVNGDPFFLHKDPVTDFRLVYFREIKKKIENMVEVETITTFNLGWQSTINGENIQRIVTLN